MASNSILDVSRPASAPAPAAASPRVGRKFLEGPIPVALVTAALLLPFVNKAWHIDDTVFLRVGERILEHPLAPYDFEHNWSRKPTSMWEESQHPPLDGYILAGIALVSGTRELSEPVAHLWYFGIAVASAVLMHWLARRWCRRPTLATLLAVCSPAFLVSAGTVMADLPLLFFWLLAVAATVHGVERRRPSMLWVAALAASCAAMTKYFGIAVVPLIAVYWFLKRPRVTMHSFAFGLPLAVLLAWGFYSKAHCGFFHPLGAAQFAVNAKKSPTAYLGNAAAAITYLGGSLLWPLFTWSTGLAMRSSWRWGMAALLLSGAIALAFAASWKVYNETAAQSICTQFLHASMIFGAGTLLMQCVGSVAARRDAESWLLILWLSGTFVFAAFLNWTVNSRIWLPAIFPAGVLFVRWIDSRIDAVPLLRFSNWVVAPLVAVSLLVAAGDYDFAGASREFARTTARELLSKGHRVLFSGHWGFQYYMEQEGAEPIDYNGEPIYGGDYLVFPVNNSGLPISLVGVERIALEHHDSRFHFTTYDGPHGGGFYAGGWRSPPFYFKLDGPIEIFRVERNGNDSTPPSSLKHPIEVPEDPAVR